MVNIIKKHLYLAIFSFLLLILGCSSESTAPLNRAFHNTTSRYNAYYIGLEKIHQVEESIWKAMKPDYNHVLKIYPPLDSTMATTYKEDLEDIIKKASIVIQYHQNSKWVDDAYNLIGQARMYGYDFPNAVTTFKYVNTQAKDINARHWAIVNLMRVFIENNELANAEEASQYLETEILNKNNLKSLYLTRAYYFQVLDDKDNMVRNLVLADPLLSRSERARFYFIIGQTYQELGFSSAAYEYYRKCITSNPNYELSFYAKLNIAQVTELGDSKDLKKVRKYFRKLVKDEKNKEFQDRIYYEWGKFELKHKHLDLAMDKFNLSVRSSISNNRQKGVSYVSLGEIYYDTLKNYEVAQAYYDSAVSVLPPAYENYTAVKTRAEVLTNFITQIKTIALQDSLLTLAEMDSANVMNIFITKATTEQDALEFEEKQAAEQERQVGSLANFDQPTGVGSSNWYFSNTSAIGAGRTSFRQVWGTRSLEDHWRRSIKQAVGSSGTKTENNTTEDKFADVNDELSRDQKIMNKAIGMYKQLPLTEAAKEEAHTKLENAYYNLGKIYYFDLEEKENAISTFTTLHSNYSQSEYSAETYYLQYLAYLDLKRDDKAKEISDFMHLGMPNSIYTKLIDNPDFEEDSNLANEILTKKYSEVYALYKRELYDSANQVISGLLQEYPDVSFSANLRLLQILIIGHTQQLADYQLELQEFIEQNPDHELNKYARELLEASKTYRSNLVKLKSAEYFEAQTGDYFYVVANSVGQNSFEEQLKTFVDTNFASEPIEVGTLSLSDSIQLNIVEPFRSKEDALLFNDLVKAEQLLGDAVERSFVISETNFDILYKTKELDAYLVFYQEHF